MPIPHLFGDKKCIPTFQQPGKFSMIHGAIITTIIRTVQSTDIKFLWIKIILVSTKVIDIEYPTMHGFTFPFVCLGVKKFRIRSV